jgi:hypothetical protein
LPQRVLRCGSSPRQAFLSCPRTTDPRPAASQLGSTLSVGGPPPRARAFSLRDGTFSGCCSPRETSVGCSCPGGDIRRQIPDGWLPMSDRCLRRYGPD